MAEVGKDFIGAADVSYLQSPTLLRILTHLVFERI